MANFFMNIFISISKILFGGDYYSVMRRELYELLCVWNSNFAESYPYAFLNVICGIFILLFVYLLIRVLQQIIGIISKIIGGLF